MLKDSPEGHRREQQLDQELFPAERTAQFQPRSTYRQDPAEGFVLGRHMRIAASTLAYGFTRDDVIYHPDRPEQERTKRRVSSSFTVESDLPFSSIRPNTDGEGNNFR